MPRFGTAGEPLAYRVFIRNDGPRPRRGPHAAGGHRRSAPLAGGVSGRARARTRSAATGSTARWAIRAGCGSSVSVRARWRGSGPCRRCCRAWKRRRGWRRCPRAAAGSAWWASTIARPDPFGLFRGFVRVAAPQSVLVLPRRYPVPDLDLPGKRTVPARGRGAGRVGGRLGGVRLAAGLPAGRSPAPDPLAELGAGGASHREGVPGRVLRPPRARARHLRAAGAPARRRSSRRRCRWRPRSRWPSPRQDSLLDLMFVGPEAYCFTAGRGLAHADRMLEVLAGVEPCAGRPFDVLRDSVLERHGELSGAICVLLGWDDERRALVRALRALGVPTLTLRGDARGRPGCGDRDRRRRGARAAPARGRAHRRGARRAYDARPGPAAAAAGAGADCSGDGRRVSGRRPSSMAAIVEGRARRPVALGAGARRLQPRLRPLQPHPRGARRLSRRHHRCRRACSP